MRPSLQWVERGLFACGVVLAAWCAVTIIEQRFFEQLPRPVQSVERLPGDPGSGTPSPSTPVKAGTWVAHLEAPSVHLAATVLEGSDDATLAKAAGHIEDTAFPGEPGNVAIAGHRDTTFRPVRRLKVGDTLVLETSAATFTYRIAWTKVVGPDDVYVIDPTKAPSLTLVTCYPFEFIGHAPRRFIVRAVETGRQPPVKR